MAADHSSCCGTSESLSDLTNRLRRKARRITGPRQSILKLLKKHRRPMTSKEIHQTLPGGLCDLATIYRSMHMLEKMRMVQRFDFGDGVARFELVGESDRSHHHHLICRQCTSVVEVSDCFSEELEKQIAAASGFAAVTHKLEFFGVCPDCQNKKRLSQ